MPPAHQPHRPRSLRWLGVLALALLCAALVAMVWIAGPENVFPSDPGVSASTTP
jgi:ferric-dicitrate binding protein FerR (iron transport regulator)